MSEGCSRNIDSPEANSIFLLVRNIPLEFRTPDLRNFFSYSIEAESFRVFNFRKRPHTSGKFNMCIVKIKANKFDELIKLYDNKNWIDRTGKFLKSKCSIVKIKKTTYKQNSDETSSLEEVDNFKDLLEFKRIPHWMPNGNVGTPTKVFIGYINRCIMPQSLIGRLGLNLKNYRRHKKKPYSNVEYDYKKAEEEQYYYYEEEEMSETPDTEVEMAVTGNGHAISVNSDDGSEIRKMNYLLKKSSQGQDGKRTEDSDETEGEDNDQGNELEEWDRHEALNDDVTKQDRTSPVFFEEEIELKWEKGGSGLVFYTDNNFWKDHENKDFDAECADDVDVDMSVYYEANGGDKDMRDLMQLRREDMLREGKSDLCSDKDKLDAEASFNPFSKRSLQFIGRPKSQKLGSFEQHTKCFGRKLLEKQGWKEGDAVGMPGRSGLKEALDASDGKMPKDRTGLGFHGERVDKEDLIAKQRQMFEAQKRANPFYIASKFDSDPSKPETLMRRYESTMKYRKK